MQDEPQAELTPFARGQQYAQVGLDLHRIVVAREPEPPRQSSDVRVNRKARQVEGDAAHDVGGLATNPGKRDEMFHLRGHLAAELRDDGIRHSDEIACLRPEETRGPHDFLHLTHVGDSERLGIGKATEQIRSHHVYPGVGALRRQDRGGEQLKRCFMGEFTHGDRVVGLQVAENRRCVSDQLGLARTRRHVVNGTRQPWITTLSAWRSSFFRVHATHG